MKINRTVIEITWAGNPKAVREAIEEGVDHLFMEAANLTRGPEQMSSTIAHYEVLGITSGVQS